VVRRGRHAPAEDPDAVFKEEGERPLTFGRGNPTKHHKSVPRKVPLTAPVTAASCSTWCGSNCQRRSICLSNFQCTRQLVFPLS